MANIDYVTSHQGQAHITTQNVIDLLAGISGDVRGIKTFPQLYNGLSHEITDALTIQVKTGAALAGGSFFILEESFDWMLDPGAVGYSRIDVLYVVMSEDPDTAVQSCDFVYEVGNLYPNGTTGTAPSAPTGTNITATYPFLRMDMTDGSIVSVTDYAQPYLSNSSLVETVNELVEQLEQSIGGTVEQVNTNTNDIAQMKVTFQSGVDTIVDAIERNGVTPSASTPSACADGIDDVATNKYNAGHNAGYKAQHIIRIILATFLSSRNEEGGFTINRSNLNVSKIVFVGAETSSTVRVILRGNSGSQELKNSTGVSNGETYNISNYSASTYPNLAIQHYAGSNPNLAVDLYVDF